MNADAEFVQFLKDKADEHKKISQNRFLELQCRLIHLSKMHAFREALKAIGITYEPHMEKEIEETEEDRAACAADDKAKMQREDFTDVDHDG